MALLDDFETRFKDILIKADPSLTDLHRAMIAHRYFGTEKGPVTNAGFRRNYPAYAELTNSELATALQEALAILKEVMEENKVMRVGDLLDQ